jgi:hypothetical protein
VNKSNVYIILGLIAVGVVLIGLGYLLGNAYPFQSRNETTYVVMVKDYKESIYQNEKEKLQINNKYSLDTLYWSNIFPDSVLYSKLMEYSRQLRSADTLR